MIIDKYCDKCGSLLPFNNKGIWFEEDNRTLVCRGKRARFTSSEALITKILLRRSPNTVSRDYLMGLIYNEKNWRDPKILDVWISKVRRRFRKAGIFQVTITAEYGVGYSLHIKVE